jgi:hypothetical protein
MAGPQVLIARRASIETSGVVAVDLRVDVENTFTAFVRSYGGEVVRDLVGASPAFLNADYLFRKQGVVAELKCLTEDKSADARMRTKINTKFLEWMNRRLIGPIYGRVQIQSRTLPIECQRELMAIVAAPLRSHIRKANDQIKSTISQLRLENAKGLLILVNDGNYSLETDATLYLVGRILGSRFRSIHSVVYLTVNLYAHAPGTAGPLLVWVHAAGGSIPSVDYHFIDDLFAAWRVYLGRITNHEIGLVPVTRREDVSSLRFERRGR